MLLIHPGEKHGPIMLLDALREIHGELQAERAKEIAERKKNNVPLDDSTDWSQVEAARDELVASVASKDAKSTTEHAGKLAALTAGNKLEPIPDFEADPELEGVAVELVVMSDADRRMCLAQVADGWRALRDAHIGGAGQVVVREADEAIVQAQERMVRLGVARVLGLDGGPVIDVASMLPSIRRSGLLAPLYQVASHFQGLSAKKAQRFGQPPQSTSQSTTAPNVQSIVVVSSDVTATAASGLPVLPTRTVPAQGGTFLQTPT